MPELYGMKIKSLQLKNFKRFTDLTLQDIPANAKLVLLIGSNGSGKSSVFDAFEAVNKVLKRTQNKKDLSSFYDEGELEYYHKEINKLFEIKFKANNSGKEQYVTTNSSNLTNSGNNFYGRTSFRNVARLQRSALGSKGINFEADEDRPKTFIDTDERFENDVELTLGNILSDVFKTSVSTEEIRKKYLNPLNDSLERIFQKTNGTKLSITEFVPPVEGAPFDIKFTKGTSVISYNLLSAGEKSIIILLLNLQARSKYFKNTLFYIDEADIHLNTAIQTALLKEIVEHWIPEDSQLWTASHSLGFIEYANENENACILDFDDLDFDKPQILFPQPKNNYEVFEIAVGKSFIDKFVQGRKLIFSENQDTVLYNDLAFENILFCIANDKVDVFHKAKNYNHYGLVDRDFLSDSDIIEIQKAYPFLFILPYYSIENLLYHPKNLIEYYAKKQVAFNDEEYTNKLCDIKNSEKDYLLVNIVQARSAYPYYKENEQVKKLKTFRDNYKQVVDLLRSDVFEEFYKVFPMKDYATQLPERQHLSKVELAKTNWFKTQIETIIK